MKLAPPTTPRQKRIALAVAVAADLAQLALAPLFAEGVLSPFAGTLDLMVALTLILTLGWRWRTALALSIELLPAVALFPSWTAAVATLRTTPAPTLAPAPNRAPTAHRG